MEDYFGKGSSKIKYYISAWVFSVIQKITLKLASAQSLTNFTNKGEW